MTVAFPFINSNDLDLVVFAGVVGFAFPLLFGVAVLTVLDWLDGGRE